MNNMTVVYADAEEKYVKNVILYGKTADNYLYTDSKCSEANKVDKDTLLNLRKKGVIISYNSTYYMPLCCYSRCSSRKSLAAAYP